MDRLQKKYVEEIVPQLKQELGRNNVMALPRLAKITVSMGLGRAIDNKAILDEAAKHLATITGQKPVPCKARKSVSNFRLREGLVIGMKVTLRKQRMYEFLDRLIGLTLPRVRDFRGLDDKAFDGQGNYNLGLTEVNVFPEIDPDSVENSMGMNINIQTTADSDDDARLLLTRMGMPFRTEESN